MYSWNVAIYYYSIISSYWRQKPEPLLYIKWNNHRDFIHNYCYLYRTPKVTQLFMMPSAKSVTIWSPCFWNTPLTSPSPTTMASMHYIMQPFAGTPGKSCFLVFHTGIPCFVRIHPLMCSLYDNFFLLAVLHEGWGWDCGAMGMHIRRGHPYKEFESIYYELILVIPGVKYQWTKGR